MQAFRAIGKNPPPAWYERPIFYHPSRFSVCGARRFLKPGDAVELEVEGIGILRNRVVK